MNKHQVKYLNQFLPIQKFRSYLFHRLDNWTERSTVTSVYPIKFIYRNIFVVPHKASFYFLLLIGLQLIAGINYSNNIIFAYTFLNFTLLLTIPFASYKIIRSITINYEVPSLFPANRDIPLKLKIDEASSVPIIRVGIKTSNTHNTSETITSEHNTIFTHLPKGKRGGYKAEKIEIYTSYPFGLFVAKAFFKLKENITLYPEPIGNPLISNFNIKLYADNQEEFSTHKPYRTGDRGSNIDWKVFGKTRKLYSKEYQGSSKEQTLDFNYDMLEGNKEQKLSQLSLWIQEAHNLNLPYQLTLPSANVTGQGSKHLNDCRIALAKY